MGQVTGHHQCMSKRRIPFQTPLQSKFKITIIFILGAMNIIFHNPIITVINGVAPRGNV